MEDNYTELARGLLQTARSAHITLENSMDEIAIWFEGLDKNIQDPIGNIVDTIQANQICALEQASIIFSRVKKNYANDEGTPRLVANCISQFVRFNRQILTNGQSGDTMNHATSTLSKIHIPRAHSLYQVVSSPVPMGKGISHHIYFNCPNILPLERHVPSGNFKYVTNGRILITRSMDHLKSSPDVYTADKIGCTPFKDPWCLAVHPHTGDVYLCDSENNRIVQMTHDLRFIRQFPENSHGTDDLPLYSPWGISVSPSGIVAFVDCSNHRVVLLKDNLEFIEFVGQDGTENATLHYPQCVDFDLHGNIYVTDPNRNRISVYSHENKKFLRHIADSDEKRNSAVGVIINDDEEIILSNWSESTVYKYSRNAELIQSIDIESLQSISYLARGPYGGFVLSDRDGNCVKFFSRGGNYLGKIDVQSPGGISFGLGGRLYVLDSTNSSIYVF